MDNNLFTAYIDEYSGMVYRIAYSYMKSSADSEDIMQEVFLKLYTARKEFSSSEHVKAWLIRVTVNIAKNELKAHRRKNTELIDEALPSSISDNTELHEALQELGEEHRIVVYLYYYEGYSVREIAKLLGISEDNVKTRLKRARAKLKAFLADDERS